MINYSHNELGQKFLIKSKKETIKLILFSIFIFIIFILTNVISSKTGQNLVLGKAFIGLILFLSLISINLLVRKVNNTASEIIIDKNDLTLCTFSILFKKSKCLRLSQINKPALKKEHFNIYNHINVDGLLIKNGNTTIRIIKPFFKEDLENELIHLIE